MRRLLVVPVLAAAAFAVGPADAQDTPLPLEEPLQLNVDRDPALETIRVRTVRCYVDGETSPPPCADPDGVRDIMVELVNVCDGAEKATPLLVRTENFVSGAQSLEIDGDPADREFIIAAASGASGRNGQIVVGDVRDRGDGCPRVKRLLSLGPFRAATVRPKGAKYHSTGDVVAENLRKDFKGKELQVLQPWYTSRDAGCCPSFVSKALYRYKASTDSYVRYKSVTMRSDEVR